MRGIKAIVFSAVISAMFLAGIIAFGAELETPKVEAWIQDRQVSIVVDGKTLELPEGSHILNFNGRIHTPVRAIVESLGAEVMWDESSQTIIIVSAQPEIIEVETPPETVVTEQPPTTTVPNRNYSPLPIRRVVRDVSLNVSAMEFYLSQTEVVLDIDSRSNWPIMFMENQTYIEFRGERFPIIDDFGPLFRNSLPNGFEQRGVRMKFAPLPEEIVRSGANIDEIRLVITAEIIESMFSGEQPELVTFEFNVDPANEPFFNFRR